MINVALMGNQNSGKTSLFNLLTGSNQTVGNWPGVTIEKKSGIISGTDILITDLPGVYSLSPYTLEEEVSRKFINENKIDVIINILDATSFERSLYLTTQLLELGVKVIVALNMADVLEKKSIEINVNKLEELLKTPVIKISALKNIGIDDLIEKIKTDFEYHEISIYEDIVEKEISSVRRILDCSRFEAVKALENDQIFKNDNELVLDSSKKLEDYYGYDTEQLFANQRYNFIEKLKSEVIKQPVIKKTITDKLDSIFLNKYFAIPIFLLIMSFVYFITIGVVGNFTAGWIQDIIDLLIDFLQGNDTKTGLLVELGASKWSISLLCDGIISGVGAVLEFIPQLIVLFASIAVLETTGYMSRIAFFLDKIFKKLGLSGKSLIPFIVGSGCSVPGIMTARTVEDLKERKITIMCTPFIPCSAKLPIIILFANKIINGGIIKTTLFAISFYLLAIVLIVLSALILKKIFSKHNTSAFISELPEYKIPSFKYVFKDVLDKTLSFIKKAGTIILICSLIIWFMLSFSWRFEYGVNIENSILAGIGNALSWFFYPMLGTFSWEATVSAIQGLVAKEQVVSSMSVIANMKSGSDLFSSQSFGFFTASSAYAFCVFNLFSAPCFAAVAAMKQELGSFKNLLFAVFYQTMIAWILAVSCRFILLIFGV